MKREPDAVLFEYKGRRRGVDMGLDPVHLRIINEIAGKMGGYVASVCIGHNLDSRRLKERGASRGPHIRLRFRSLRLAKQVSALDWSGQADTRTQIFKSGNSWYASISRSKGSRSLEIKKEWWRRAVDVLVAFRGPR